MSKIYVLLLTKNKTVYNLKSTLLFLCICFISSNVFGQKTWTGVGSTLTATGNNFNDAANWNPAVVPTSSDNIIMNLIAGATINLSSNITINKLKLFLNGNNTIVKLNVGANLFTINDSADIDIITGNPNTELYIGVNDNTSQGTIDFKGYASFGKTDQGGTGTTSNVYINANVNSKIILRGDLVLGRLARITSGQEFGTLIFDGTGPQNITTNNNGNSSICSFKNVVIGSSSNSTAVNLVVGTKNFVDPILGNLTVSNSAILNVGMSRWNRSSLGGTLTLKPTSKLILSDVTGGTTGSNFPSLFAAYNLDSTSTVEFNGTTQIIPGENELVKNYGNLTLSNGNTKTLGSKIAIFRCLTLAINTTMELGAFDAVLKSNYVTTAYVSAVPITAILSYGGTGRFEVERYLYPQKSWRLLSVPLQKFANDATASTINSSWREGGTTLTGFGTRITGVGTIAYPGGVDEYTQRPSMKYYDTAINDYTPITATNLAANKTIANNEGYYIFVRGDRGISVPSLATGATILRAKGKLRTGDQIYTIKAKSFQSIGNPFASRIQFSRITKTTNIENSFVAWNPTNTSGGYGVGRFQQYALTGSDYYSALYGIKNFIESGEAFFVSNIGTGSGTITIKESDKGAGSSLYSRVGITFPTLEINLYTKATDNTDFKVDGTVLNFDPSFSNLINNDDVKKFNNASDNLYILKNNTKLFAERRATLQMNDTIFLALSNTRLGLYRFNIDPSVLGNLPLKAYLKDKFLQTEIPVSLSETTDINFEITNDPNSRVVDRFMIVFKKFLPLRFTAITAVRKSDKPINLTWNTENENNIDNYRIERSTDGVNFIEIGSQMPTANNFGNPYYTFYDAKASKEIIYYRIKGNGITGNSIYSNTAKVLAFEENNNKPVNIFPNPVTNGNININFEGAVLGNYVSTINNFTGQLIKSETFRHQVIGESCIIKILNAGGGFYTANIVDETGIKKMIPFLIK